MYCLDTIKAEREKINELVEEAHVETGINKSFLRRFLKESAEDKIGDKHDQYEDMVELRDMIIKNRTKTGTPGGTP